MSEQTYVVETTTQTYFEIVDTGIDVSAFVERLEQNMDDWHYTGIWTTAGSTLPYGMIPLTVAAPPEEGVNVNDTDRVYDTSYYHKYEDIRQWAHDRGYQYISRCAFLSLGVGSATEINNSTGKYFDNKTRYCLTIKGKALFTIHGQEYVIEPGTLYRFDPSCLHADMNIGDEDKWSFVFDVLKVDQVDEEMRGDSGEESVS